MVSVTLKNILAYLKTNWRSILTVIVLVLASLGVYSLFRRTQEDFVAKLRVLQAAHDAEMAAVEAARATERREHEENLRRLQAALDEARQQYESDMKALTEKKQRQVTQLVVKYGDDPTEMARQVAAATGFQLVLPE